METLWESLTKGSHQPAGFLGVHTHFENWLVGGGALQALLDWWIKSLEVFDHFWFFWLFVGDY